MSFLACAEVERWFGAFPTVPDLLARGRNDGVGAACMQMQAEGSLRIFGAGERVSAIGSDHYRQAEIRTALAAACVPWAQVWRQ